MILWKEQLTYTKEDYDYWRPKTTFGWKGMDKAAQCSLRVCSSAPVLEISKDENGERKSQGPPRVMDAELLLWTVIGTYLRSNFYPQGGAPLLFLPKGISEVLQNSDCCRFSILPLISPLWVGVNWAYDFLVPRFPDQGELYLHLYRNSCVLLRNPRHALTWRKYHKLRHRSRTN